MIVERIQSNGIRMMIMVGSKIIKALTLIFLPVEFRSPVKTLVKSR